MLFLYPVSAVNLQLAWLNETNANTILEGSAYGKRVYVNSCYIVIVFIYIFVSPSFLLKFVAVCCFA